MKEKEGKKQKGGRGEKREGRKQGEEVRKRETKILIY